MAIERITKYRVKQNKIGQWFWDEVAANGEIVGTAGQSFSSQDAAIRACQNAKARTAAAPIEVDDSAAAMNAMIRRLAANRVVRPDSQLLASRLFSHQPTTRR